MALSKQTNERFSIIVWNNNDKFVSQRIDLDGSYMEANEIAMCSKKKTFALAYNDDGNFKLIVFTDSDIKRKIDLNKLVSIEQVDNDLSTPLINCQFIQEELILVNYFDTSTLTNNYFIYNYTTHLVEF